MPIINRTNDYDLKMQRDEAREWARKMKAERDELYAENQRLRELIKRVEWIRAVTGKPHCPHCKRFTEYGHSPSCPAFGDNGILSR